MSRYTPKLQKKEAGGGPARPAKPGSNVTPPKAAKKTSTPGAYACDQCDKRFNTEEALATHAADAHGKAIDVAELSPVAKGMARCPRCGAVLSKRNLERHLRFVHFST